VAEARDGRVGREVKSSSGRAHQIDS